MTLQEMLKKRAFALNKAEGLVGAAELAGREMTETESNEYDTAMAAVQSLSPQIARIERSNSILGALKEGKLIPAAGNLRAARTPNAPVVLSEDYYNDFHAWVATRGQQIGAALYEGTGSAGGYTVPVIVDGNVIPLAPAEMGVRTVALVVPTTSDIKIPIQLTKSEAAGKDESGATEDSFEEADPTLDQVTLSAFMAGDYVPVSWELAQDVPSFQNFCISDLIQSVQTYEENLYVNGTGVKQAQGLIGNTGAGVTGVLAGTDSYASELLGATEDVLGKLKGAYHIGAGWLMQRATGVVIRKAQRQANLFQPVWTRENGQDYLHGYKVTYSDPMPTIGAGNTPVLFGDFKAGYVIGDRGGSGINVKILDQPKALQGQLILLAYRRTDGRVRRSEAIQAITLA